MLKPADHKSDRSAFTDESSKSDSSAWIRVARWWRSYGVAIILLVVATHQMYRVHFQGWNAWRGGGFGMYSGFHPRHTDIWIERTDTGEARRYAKYEGTKDALTSRVRPNVTHVDAERLGELKQHFDENERPHVRITTVQLDFDPHSLTLQRRTLAESPAEDK